MNLSSPIASPLPPARVDRSERKFRLNALSQQNPLRVFSQLKWAKKGRPLHVLIVDDDRAVGRAVAMSLRDLGHTSDFCLNAREALIKLRNIHFDLIFTDYRMPELTGFEFAQQAKKWNASTPIILITAWAPSFQIAQAADYGISLVLEKPLELTHLRQAIGNVMDN